MAAVSDPKTIKTATRIVRRNGAAAVRKIAADICVVGAGIAGISAALEAAALGRKVVLVDAAGRSFAPSPEGQMAAHARLNGNSTPLAQPLRPGESYTTDFVFDVPRNAQGLRLLLTEDDPETRFVIGHENSFLHKKIYFGLDAVRALGSESFTLPRVLAEQNI